MARADFTGTWNLDAAASGNPEAVAELEGRGWVARKAIANTTNVKLTIAQTAETFSIKMETTFKNEEGTVNLNGAEEEHDVDGHKTKVTATFEEDGKVLLVTHRYTNANGKTSERTIRRHLEDDGKTLVAETTVTVEGQTASVKRVFRKA